jgi:pimeloyl-ACP methyl ester carboxylesterase
MKKFLQKWWWLVILVPVVLIAGFVIWANNSLQPMPEALAALESDELVQVQTEPWLEFSPTHGSPNTGVIFYPGGKVDPRAYAPPMHQLAAQGYLAVIVPMPLNLAVFAPGKASQVITAHPEIQHWIIGGHSLGGAMAANFVKKNPSSVDGLFFWAAYPGSGDDLSQQAIKVVSVSASLDGLATPDKIDASRALLPADTGWIVIEGGNHAQFGWYGDQPGDNPAEISREEQQRIAVQAVLDLIKTYIY